MPGALMAMIRLNRPLLVYGGTMAPGCYKGKKLDVWKHLKLGVKISEKYLMKTMTM